MRNHTIIALFFSLSLIACEKKEEPQEETKPQDTSVTESTVGQSGGKLITENFELIIPPGAFSSDHSVKISSIETESDFGENSISQQYLLEGIPEELAKPLKVKIKYTGTLSDQTFMAAGEEAMNGGTGAEDVFYHFLEGTDSSGFIVATYPPDSLFPDTKSVPAYKSIQGQKWIRLEVVSDFISAYHAGTGTHTYDIYIRKDLNNLKADVIGYFDQAYFTYLDVLKFNYDFYVDLLLFGNYKINRILVSNVKEDIYCKYLWKKSNKKLPGGIFVINAKKLDDTEGMKRMIAREVFRSILFTYDDNYPEMRPPELVEHHWLNQALISWSEEFFAPAGQLENYIPSDFEGNEMAPLSGIKYLSYLTENAGEKVMDYGAGQSATIKYLSMIDSESGIDTMWAYYYDIWIRQGGSPDGAVIQRMNNAYDNLFNTFKYFESTTYDFYRGFLNSYLLGNVYGVEASTFLDAIPDENKWTIEKEDDTIRRFSQVYPDLSAQLFRLDLNNSGTQKEGKIYLDLYGDIQGNATLDVFGYRDGKLTWLDYATMGSLSDLSQYDTYLIMVINDYFSSFSSADQQIDLEIKVVKQSELQFNRLNINLSLRRVMETRYSDNPDIQPTVDTSDFNVRWYFEGSFTGNVFKGKLDPEKHSWDNTTVTDSVLITLDDFHNLISLDLAINLQQTSGTQSYGLYCSDMLPKIYDDTWLIYDSRYDMTCFDIDNFIYSATIGTYSTKSIGFLCNENSYLEIKFSAE